MAIATGATAAMLLAGCGSGADSSGNAAAQSSPTHSGPTRSGPTTTSPSSKSPAPNGAAQTRTALKAVVTAQKSVTDGKVFDLEGDTHHGQRVWEAKVADPKGNQHDLIITVDGSTVGDRRQDPTPDDDIAKLRKATVSVERAVHIAAGHASGKGELSSLEIDTFRGNTVVWQVGFGGDNGTTVIVDARSGKVLAVGNDAG
jgi:uncharacterized membrane protein YkoI